MLVVKMAARSAETMAVEMVAPMVGLMANQVAGKLVDVWAAK